MKKSGMAEENRLLDSEFVKIQARCFRSFRDSQKSAASFCRAYVPLVTPSCSTKKRNYVIKRQHSCVMPTSISENLAESLLMRDFYCFCCHKKYLDLKHSVIAHKFPQIKRDHLDALFASTSTTAEGYLDFKTIKAVFFADNLLKVHRRYLAAMSDREKMIY